MTISKDYTHLFFVSVVYRVDIESVEGRDTAGFELLVYR